jgi:hypothetical protein
LFASLFPSLSKTPKTSQEALTRYQKTKKSRKGFTTAIFYPGIIKVFALQ